ncbi:GFA family protein [Phenylobacterium aquaticum]|uniref:GFA family protein n=1 Tax=Phenylobacterium aquaticum TaxID=1763816 RepID=UPI0026EE582F|nr:aldehyde-activating protein [Phenylobacterium aquaticum]
MSDALTGQCHCGAIAVAFEPGRPVAELPLRACQCGFCRRHGALTSSDPSSRLRIEAKVGAITRYRFGRRATDALICSVCGVYVASAIEAEGQMFATLNIAGVGIDAFAGRDPEPAVYDFETDEAKLARRLSRWTPTVLVETRLSA